MPSTNKQLIKEASRPLTLFEMLANAVLRTVPLTVQGIPCGLPTISLLPVLLEILFIATTSLSYKPWHTP